MNSLRPKSIVVFVNAVDNANNPIMCAINIQGVGQYNNIVIDTNLISSVYGKDTNPVGFIQKAVSDNRILYWNKKRSQELSVKTGLQLSNLLTNLDSDVIIRKTNQNVNNNLQKSFTGNIRFSYTNSKDSQGNTLSKEQEELFKDSKVRNDKGELEVVYHGTVGEFHTFDKTYLKCRIYEFAKCCYCS